MNRKYIIIGLILIGIIILSGCVNSVKSESEGTSKLPQGIYRFHDDEYNVTCWGQFNGGLSCIPDHELKGE